MVGYVGKMKDGTVVRVNYRVSNVGQRDDHFRIIAINDILDDDEFMLDSYFAEINYPSCECYKVYGFTEEQLSDIVDFVLNKTDNGNKIDIQYEDDDYSIRYIECN